MTSTYLSYDLVCETASAIVAEVHSDNDIALEYETEWVSIDARWDRYIVSWNGLKGASDGRQRSTIHQPLITSRRPIIATSSSFETISNELSSNKIKSNNHS